MGKRGVPHPTWRTQRNDSLASESIALYRQGYSFSEIENRLSMTAVKAYIIRGLLFRRGLLTDEARADNQRNRRERQREIARERLKRADSKRGCSLREHREKKRRELLRELGLPEELSYRQLQILLLLLRSKSMTYEQLQQATGCQKLSGSHRAATGKGRSPSYLTDLVDRGLVVYRIRFGHKRLPGSYELSEQATSILRTHHVEQPGHPTGDRVERSGHSQGPADAAGSGDHQPIHQQSEDR